MKGAEHAILALEYFGQKSLKTQQIQEGHSDLTSLPENRR
jgi:hypothetical protein